MRGKIVLLVRFMGIDTGTRGLVDGSSVDIGISNVIKRGAAGVIFVDRSVGTPGSSLYPRSVLALNSYAALEELSPPLSTSGVPVVVVDPEAARALVAPLGLDFAPLLGYDPAGKKWDGSLSRDLGVPARIAVPLREDVSTTRASQRRSLGFRPRLAAS